MQPGYQGVANAKGQTFGSRTDHDCRGFEACGVEGVEGLGNVGIGDRADRCSSPKVRKIAVRIRRIAAAQSECLPSKGS